MNFSRLLIRNIVFRGLSISAGLIVTILLTRLMGTEGYGALALLIANASVFSLVSCLGSESGITYHYAADSMQRSKIFSIIYLIIFFQLVLLTAVEFIFYNISGHYWLIEKSEMKFLSWSLIYLFSLTIIDKYTAFLNGSHLYTLANKIVFFTNIITLLLFGGLYFFYEKRETIFYLQIFIISNFIQALIMVIAFHWFSKQPLLFTRIAKNDWKIFFSYSSLVFVTNVIQFFAYRIDYWLVDYYSGSDALGLYSLAVRLGQLFWVLPLLFASIVFPRVADKKMNYDGFAFLRLLRITNAFLLLALILAAALANLVIPLFFGEDFRNSVTAFLYRLPGIFLFSTNIMLAAYFAGINRLKVNFIGSTMCFLLVLLLDLWLIPLNGINGAAIASSIAYAAATIYSVWQFIVIGNSSLKDIFLIQRDDWKLTKNLFNKMFS